MVVFKSETATAHAPTAAGRVEEVKSELGAGATVSQKGMRPRVLEIRVSKASAARS